MTNDVVGCARCGRDHPGLTFAELARPVEISDPPMTYWAACPTTGEPILLAVVARDA